MEQLIKQALNTLSVLGKSNQIALYKIINNYHCSVFGGLIKGEYILPREEHIVFKDTPLEQVVLTRQTENFPGTLVDSLPFPDYNHNISAEFECLCLPLLNEKHQVGGIAVLSQKVGNSIACERLETLNTLGFMITAIMTASQENEHLIQIATKDNLTGLYTRNYFDKRLQEEFIRIRRHGGVMSLLLIDVDHFKQINDTCGSKEANRVLQQVAKLLISSIRKELDIPCRYAGKQFILLLPNTNVDGAYVLAERIRRRCEQHLFTTLQGIPLKVTLSLGIAHNIDITHDDHLNDNSSQSGTTLHTNEVTKDELIYRADLMLYAAKQAGCNKVMVWW